MSSASQQQQSPSPLPSPFAQSLLYTHIEEDEFYDVSKGKGFDLEAACLMPAEPFPTNDPDAESSGSPAPARYPRHIWFRDSKREKRGSAHSIEKGTPIAEGARMSRWERRMLAGSWLAVALLFVLAVCFIFREL